MKNVLKNKSCFHNLFRQKKNKFILNFIIKSIKKFN
jgi:hypothetical protein